VLNDILRIPYMHTYDYSAQFAQLKLQGPNSMAIKLKLAQLKLTRAKNLWAMGENAFAELQRCFSSKLGKFSTSVKNFGIY
jgi:hypothetical protein